MKSPDFSYLKAQTMADVFLALQAHGDSAQLLAVPKPFGHVEFAHGQSQDTHRHQRP
jgi:hypothetical protein